MQTVKRPRRNPLRDGIRAETAAAAAVRERGREVEAEKRAGDAAGAAVAGEKAEAMVRRRGGQILQ